jgi:hypothetical protein
MSLDSLLLLHLRMNLSLITTWCLDLIAASAISLFRLLRRPAPIYCQMCCVNTSIICQKALRNSIPIVRYCSQTFNLMLYKYVVSIKSHLAMVFGRTTEARWVSHLCLYSSVKWKDLIVFLFLIFCSLRWHEQATVQVRCDKKTCMRVYEYKHQSYLNNSCFIGILVGGWVCWGNKQTLAMRSYCNCDEEMLSSPWDRSCLQDMILYNRKGSKYI